jgi:nitroimidazol reductase NimA-like FMN-containing flavoprotein (pyridoxamine 5'-phosphate oxidase superfamily)
MTTNATATAVRVAEFSDPQAPAVSWAEVDEILTRSEMYWLSTVRRDGRPHVAPLPAIWLDGALHFCTGAHEQKARNLQAEPRCVLTTGTNTYRSGTDVVVEGTAERVTGRARLTRLSREWMSKLDWDFRPTDDGFYDGDVDGRTAAPVRTARAGASQRAPASEERTAVPTGIVPVFAVRPSKVLVFAKAPYSQTRFTFAQA